MITLAQMKRLEALEAQARQDDIDPYVTFTAERHGVSREDVLAEAEQVAKATAGMSPAEQRAWTARQCGISVEAVDQEIEADREAFTLWRLERSRA